MELPNSSIIDIAQKRTHPYISLGERFPVDNISAKLSFELQDKIISSFIIDFSSGNSKYKYDLGRLVENIEHIKYISFSDLYLSNQFVNNYYPFYKLSKSLTIKIIIGKGYEYPIKLTGNNLKQLNFEFDI